MKSPQPCRTRKFPSANSAPRSCWRDGWLMSRSSGVSKDACCFSSTVSRTLGAEASVRHEHIANLGDSLGLKQQKFIKWAGLACAMTYVAVIAVVFGHCTPIHKKWQIIPYPGGNVLFPAAVLDSWLRIFGGTICVCVCVLTPYQDTCALAVPVYLTVAALNVLLVLNRS